MSLERIGNTTSQPLEAIAAIDSNLHDLGIPLDENTVLSQPGD